jgi:hypothetical protein
MIFLPIHPEIFRCCYRRLVCIRADFLQHAAPHLPYTDQQAACQIAWQNVVKYGKQMACWCDAFLSMLEGQPVTHITPTSHAKAPVFFPPLLGSMFQTVVGRPSRIPLKHARQSRGVKAKPGVFPLLIPTHIVSC